MAEENYPSEGLSRSATTEKPVLKGTILLGGASCSVVLQNNCITWQEVEGKECSLLLDDVIGVSGRSIGSPTPHGEIVLHYVWREETTHVWSTKTMAIQAQEGSHPHRTDRWADYIQSYIDRLDRPRHLLVFVNPGSGNAKGLSVYEKNSAPLFELAGVTADVIVTKGPEDAGRVMSTYDLSSIDGIISVGGDGSLFHCLNALLERTASDAGKNLNNVDEAPIAPPIPVGIIPAGSGEGMALRMTLTRDPVTSTLHIITGERERQNVYSVHNAGKLLGYGFVLMGYGVSGDIFKFSESMRYLGKLRYVAAIVRAFAAKKNFDAEIHVKPHPGVGTAEGSTPSASLGHVTPNNSLESKLGEDGWQIYTRSFCDIHMFLMDIGPYGMIRRVEENRYMPADPNFPTLYMFEATSHCARMTLAKTIYNMYVGNDSGVVAEHVTMMKALEYKIVLKERPLGHVNVEGEVFELMDPTIHIKGHQHLVQMFGAGYAKLLGVA